MSFANLRVLFCVPAGVRRGSGHLERSLSLARELDVRPLVAVRGMGAREMALGLGAEVVAAGATAAIRALHPDVVVICDPSPRVAKKQIDAAQQVGAMVMRIYDVGNADDQVSTVRASARRSTRLVGCQRPPRAKAVAVALSQGN